MLLLWDFIYFPVPFAFQNRSQIIPIDYGSSLFYEARKPFIDEWLTQVSRLSDAQIQSRQAKEDDLIRSVSAEQHRAASKRRFSDPMGQNRRWFALPFVPSHFLEWLARLAFHLGAPRIASILARAVRNGSLYMKGLPDLTLVRDPSKEVGMPSVLFVEVKGENDRLQPDQSDWIQFFMEKSVNFELCKIGAIFGVDV